MYEINDTMIRAVRAGFIQGWARRNAIFEIRSEVYKQKYGECPELPLWDNYDDETQKIADELEVQIWQSLVSIN